MVIKSPNTHIIGWPSLDFFARLNKGHQRWSGRWERTAPSQIVQFETNSYLIGFSLQNASNDPRILRLTLRWRSWLQLWLINMWYVPYFWKARPEISSILPSISNRLELFQVFLSLFTQPSFAGSWWKIWFRDAHHKGKFRVHSTWLRVIMYASFCPQFYQLTAHTVWIIYECFKVVEKRTKYQSLDQTCL